MNQGNLKRKIFHGRGFDGHEDISKDSTAENFDQNDCGGVEVEAPSAKKHNSSPLETASVVFPSSFDFHVFEKEGINLHIDLNSSPSDYWTGRIKNELSRGENVRRIGSRSLLQDLGFLVDSSTQRRRSPWQNANSDPINDRNGQTNSCTSLEVPKDDLAWFDQQEEDDSSIMSAPLVPRSMVANAANSSKRGQVAVSAKLTATVADNLKEYQLTAAGELTATMADNLKENQSTASANLNANVVDNLKEYQSSASAELTANAAENLKEDQSTPSAELTANVAENLKEDQSTASVKGKEAGKIVNRRKSSKCSQFDDPLKKSGPDSQYRKSKLELNSKRKQVNSKDQDSSGDSFARILRSKKPIAGEGLPRRSTRLISK